MRLSISTRLGAPIGAAGRGLAVLAAALLGGCGSGDVELPPPRPLIIFTGERLTVEPERMKEIHTWLTAAVDSIEEDPSFLIERNEVPGDPYPWESLSISVDTARIRYNRGHPDAATPYMIYAFLHLMDRQDRLETWLPEAADEEGFELELAIMRRVADSWLLGRTIFDAAPYENLDHLIYAQEAGYLDDLVLVSQADRFPEARDAWLAENPNAEEEYRAWFQETFNQAPPGVRPRTGDPPGGSAGPGASDGPADGHAPADGDRPAARRGPEGRGGEGETAPAGRRP